MDWITLLIEAVGVVILLLWIVIRIQEFRQILRRVNSREVPLAEARRGARGFDVREDGTPRERPR